MLGTCRTGGLAGKEYANFLLLNLAVHDLFSLFPQAFTVGRPCSIDVSLVSCSKPADDANIYGGLHGFVRGGKSNHTLYSHNSIGCTRTEISYGLETSILPGGV